jgi:hypothetical protein
MTSRWRNAIDRFAGLSGLAAALLVLNVDAVRGGPSDAQKCEAAKLQAGGSYALCRLVAEGRFVKTGDAGKLSEARGKCDDKLVVAYSNAEAKWSPFCPTLGDVSAIQAQILDDVYDVEIDVAGLPSEPAVCLPETGQTKCYDFVGGEIACVGTLQDGHVRAGRPISFTDNGDGTITDNNTGLMWEKKSDDDSINDKDSLYTFSTTGLHAHALNQAAFAGYTDWRIPNIRELETLIHYGIASVSGERPIAPEFNKDCAPGCTVLDCSCTSPAWGYRSTTPYYAPFSNPHITAFIADFTGQGQVSSNSSKLEPGFVRAVRGGL